MAGWLCYTRKMLATAISSLADELEQTALDLNEAVHSIGMSREASLEQKLYASYDANLGSCDNTMDQSQATTQQPVKSSVLPSTVVPGDVVLEDHFSTPPTTTTTQQMTSPVTPCMTRSHSSPSHVVKLSDKRPGKVVRTSSSESCSSQADWCPEFDHTDLKDTEEVFNEATGHCPDTEEAIPRVSSFCEDKELQERLQEGETLTEKDLRSRWFNPLSRAVTLAYTQVTHAVLNLMEDVADLSDAPTTDGHPTTHLLHTFDPEHITDSTQKVCSQELSLDLPGLPAEYRTENQGLLSPVSVRSTYSTDSFEVIDQMDTVVDSPTSETGRAVFTVGDIEDDPSTGPEMTTSSAEFVQFNFSNLVSGRYFRARSPISHVSHDARVTSIPEPHVIDDQSGVRMKVNDPGFEPTLFKTVEVLSKAKSMEDDDGSSSFDILSEHSEEDYIVY